MLWPGLPHKSAHERERGPRVKAAWRCWSLLHSPSMESAAACAACRATHQHHLGRGEGGVVDEEVGQAAGVEALQVRASQTAIFAQYPGSACTACMRGVGRLLPAAVGAGLTPGSRSERPHSVMLPVRFMGPPPVAVLLKPSASAWERSNSLGKAQMLG
jgi:hypothetical protein